MITTNYLDPCGDGRKSWRRKDVEALLDRCFLGPQKGIQWDLPLPREIISSASQNALRSKCPRCSARFVEWCIAQSKNQGRIATASGHCAASTIPEDEDDEALRIMGALGFDDEP